MVGRRTKLVGLLLLFFIFISLAWWQKNQSDLLWQGMVLSDTKLDRSWLDNSLATVSQVLVEQAEKIQENVPTIKTPEPLRRNREEIAGDLTVAGIIFQTNQQRQQYDLTLLKENNLLSQAARQKLDDMIVQQYFGHVSPQGIGTAEVIAPTGYKYIAIGENLALGSYQDDAEVVKAWMESPGHRENILSKNYLEIGVAVAYVEFEGSFTWLAVQEFGRPLSACPEVEANLKKQIDNLKLDLDKQADSLAVWQTELAANRPGSDANNQTIEIYNEQVNQYNALVEKYKQAAEQLRSMVNIYNLQVESFNQCLKNINY